MFGINRKTNPNSDSGKWGERQAKRFLTKRGYKCLGERVRVPPHDEIDLIMKDDRVLVFVEVKTRRSEDMGSPADAVDHQKQKHLSRASVRYLSSKSTGPIDFRFDIVEIIGEPGDRSPIIRHHEDAFPLSDGYYPPF